MSQIFAFMKFWTETKRYGSGFLSLVNVIDTALSQVFLKFIGSFKQLDTIILRPRVAPVPEATIKKCAAALKGLQPTTNKRRMFISHEYFCESEWKNQGASRQLTGGLTEVDLS